jgi:DNA-binding LytR/AlgR family response regulator
MSVDIQILIVEPDLSAGVDLSSKLEQLGYHVAAMVTHGEDALNYISCNRTDLVFIDAGIKGKRNGVELAQALQERRNLTVIFLCTDKDHEFYIAPPGAFLMMPVTLEALKDVFFSLNGNLQHKTIPINALGKSSPFIVQDSIFVRNHERMVKIPIKNIYYIEAERNYCRIFCNDKELLLVMTLKEMDEKLPSECFVRTHRSYIVNVSHIEEVAVKHICIAKKAIPLGKAYREDLLKRLLMI